MATDFLIITASWEERFRLSFEKNIKTFNPRNIVIIHNNVDPYKSFVEPNKNICEELAKKSGVNIICIGIDILSPLDVWNGLKEQLPFKDFIGKDVVIDVSTTTRELIWYLIYFVEPEVKSLDIIYHKPEKYNHEWLTRDPVIPRLLFRHSGISSNDRKTALIVLTGYDGGRTKQLINYYEPYTTFLFIQPDNEERNSKIHESFAENFNVVIDLIDNYKEEDCYSTLKKCITSNIDNYNFIVTSLGPKIGAIQLYKLVKEFPSLALCYAPSNEYNLEYSTGIGEVIVQKFK
jgi:hypothetical protein